MHFFFCKLIVIAPVPAVPVTPGQEALETVVFIADLDKLVFGLNFRGPKMFPEEWHQVLLIPFISIISFN